MMGTTYIDISPPESIQVFHNCGPSQHISKLALVNRVVEYLHYST